jgi:hypothetical protein
MPGAPRTNPSATRGAHTDLAARLQQTATGLEDRLNRRDTLIELIRSVNGTLDRPRWAMRCSVRRPNGYTAMYRVKDQGKNGVMLAVSTIV